MSTHMLLSRDLAYIATIIGKASMPRYWHHWYNISTNGDRMNRIERKCYG